MFGYLDGSEDFYVQDEETEIKTTEEEEDLQMDEDLSTSEGLREKIQFILLIPRNMWNDSRIDKLLLLMNHQLPVNNFFSVVKN